MNSIERFHFKKHIQSFPSEEVFVTGVTAILTLSASL